MNLIRFSIRWSGWRTALRQSSLLMVGLGLFWIVPLYIRPSIASAEDAADTSWQADDAGTGSDADASDTPAADTPDASATDEDTTAAAPADGADSSDGSNTPDTPDTPDGSSSAAKPRPTAPPPEDRDWIAAWVSDLKQSSDRWIQVILSEQRLIAWEGDKQVFSTSVSTGRDGDWTPTGVYNIEEKFKTARMQGDGYDIPNVPYVMYFFGSYAIHGTFWHHNFGTPVSRGCINLEDDQAAWLFYWASEGTPVIVQDESQLE